MSSKWDDLPTELLEQIVEAVESDEEFSIRSNKNTQWAAVNKQGTSGISPSSTRKSLSFKNFKKIIKHNKLKISTRKMDQINHYR